MKKYRSIWIMGAVALIITSFLSWLMIGVGIPFTKTPLRDLAVGFVGMFTLATIYGGFLQRFQDELKALQLFKAYVDQTFMPEDQRKCVMRKLTELADRTERSSQRVIKLQQGGLREAGLLITDDDAEKEFSTEYHKATNDFRTDQMAFYAYFELVTPFAPELHLEVGDRNFKRFTSTASFREGF